MKIDLTKLPIEVDFSGKTEEINCGKEVANIVKNMTSDIGLEDVCRTIYHAEGEVDIPDEFIDVFVNMVVSSDLLAAVKRAIRDSLRS